MKKLTSQLDVLLFVVVLGACIGLVLIDLGTGVKEAQEAEKAAELALTQLKTARDEDRYTDSEGAKILASLDGIINKVEQQWNPEKPTAVGTSRLMYSPDSIDDLKQGRSWEIRFPAPLELSTRIDLGVIELAWAVDEKTSVQIANFEVFRRTGADAEAQVAVVTGANQNFQDRDVKAGVTYHYRVRAQTDDAALMAMKKTRSAFSAPTQAMGMRDYQFEAIDFVEANSQLRFLVKKHQGGVWHEKQFLAQKGQEIGERDPGTGVNYATGTTLSDLKVIREKVPQTRQEVVFDEEGRVKSSSGQAQVIDRVYQVDRLSVSMTLKTRAGDEQVKTFVKGQ